VTCPFRARTAILSSVVGYLLVSCFTDSKSIRTGMSYGLHRSARGLMRRSKAIGLPLGRLEMNFRDLVAHLDPGRQRPARLELDSTLHGLGHVFRQLVSCWAVPWLIHLQSRSHSSAVPQHKIYSIHRSVLSTPSHNKRRTTTHGRKEQEGKRGRRGQKGQLPAANRSRVVRSVSHIALTAFR